MFVFFKIILGVTLFLLSFLSTNSVSAQTDFSRTDSTLDRTGTHGTDRSHRFFIVLPLRFTQLQNVRTLLSGVKLGIRYKNRFQTALSVYHHFYVESFRPKARLATFDKKKQPVLFIYSAGLEQGYKLLEYGKLSCWPQLYLGWVSLKYEARTANFKTNTVHCFTAEPQFLVDYSFGKGSAIGIGVGYRSLIGAGKIRYTSDLSAGQIPINKNLPNGINFLVSLQGHF
jgi:hypothetical protein